MWVALVNPQEAARLTAQVMQERHTGWAAYGDDGPDSRIAEMISEALTIFAEMMEQSQ